MGGVRAARCGCGLIVGRLTGHDRLADARRVPGTAGLQVQREAMSMSINASGMAVLAWTSYRPGPDQTVLGYGPLLATVWCLGHTPGEGIEPATSSCLQKATQLRGVSVLMHRCLFGRRLEVAQLAIQNTTLMLSCRYESCTEPYRVDGASVRRVARCRSG